MSTILRISLVSVVTCLWLLLTATGCRSLSGPASASFASVTIQDHSPDEIVGATAKVFGADGYMGDRAGPGN